MPATGVRAISECTRRVGQPSAPEAGRILLQGIAPPPEAAAGIQAFSCQGGRGNAETSRRRDGALGIVGDRRPARGEPGVGYGPLYIARDKGIFKKNGVNVDLIVMEDPKERFPTMMANRIDMIASTVDTALLYMKTPHDFQYVVAIDDSNGGDGIVANKDIKTIADLKGKKVAVNEGSVSEFYLNVLLAKTGLKESDLNVVNMTASDAGSAFVSKRVDAAVTWEPWLSRGKASDHGHLLTDSSKTPGLITDALIANTSWVNSHKKDVAALVKSWYEAVAYYEAHPDDAIAIMAKGVGGWLKDPKAFKETLSEIGRASC